MKSIIAWMWFIISALISGVLMSVPIIVCAATSNVLWGLMYVIIIPIVLALGVSWSMLFDYWDI